MSRRVIGNILWIVLFGWQLFLAHIAAGIALCLTIIGIPFGIAAFKLSVLSLVPLGTRVVDADGPQTWAHPCRRLRRGPHTADRVLSLRLGWPRSLRRQRPRPTSGSSGRLARS